ncbi:MAG: hypothetical protein HC883_00005 [Bdellovibrionaceae bacterium]|nr:hypothetical protein [Pseudobdellovibrionaceae bacterium]
MTNQTSKGECHCEPYLHESCEICRSKSAPSEKQWTEGSHSGGVDERLPTQTSDADRALTAERDELQQNEHKMHAALSAKQEQLETVTAELKEAIKKCDRYYATIVRVIEEKARLREDRAALREALYRIQSYDTDGLAELALSESDARAALSKGK